MIVLKIIGYCLLAILAANLLFFFFLWIVSLTVKREPAKEVTKLRKFCSIAFYTWAVIAARVRVHVTGKEKIPKDSRFLLVSNHRGIFDPVVMGSKLGEYGLGFITKPSNLKLPIVGRLAWGCGYLPIDRENDRKALETILQAVKLLKGNVCSVVVYPEGTRSRETGMIPFHHGSFKIAQKAKVPVVVASIKNSDMVFKNFPLKVTDIYLDILEVVPVEDVVKMNTAELSDYAYNKIEEHLYG